MAAIVSAACLVLAGLALHVAQSETATRWLRGRLAAQLGSHVQFASARLRWWPRPALVLEQVALETGVNSIAASRVTCAPRLAPLLRGVVTLAAIRVDGLAATVAVPSGSAGVDPVAIALDWASALAPAQPLPSVRVHDGVVRLEQAGRPAATELGVRDAHLRAAGSGAQLDVATTLAPGGSAVLHATLGSIADPAGADLDLRLELSEVDAATIAAWVAGNGPRVTASGMVRASLRGRRRGDGPLTGAVTVELAAGALAGEGWRVDAPVRLAAHPSWEAGAVTVPDGRLDAARVTAAGITAEELSASFELPGDGAVRVPAATLRACGAVWRAAGRAGFAPGAPVAASVSAQSVDAAALLAVLASQHLSVAAAPRFAGPLDLDATGSGVVGGHWSAHAELRTGGDTQWAALRIGGPLLVRADLAGAGLALRSASGIGTAAGVTGGGLEASGVESAFEYDASGPELTLDPLRATAFGGSWRYRGTVPLGATMPWRGDLSAVGIDAALLAAAAGATGVEGRVDATASLRGTGDGTVAGRLTAHLGSDALTVGRGRLQRPAELIATVQYGNGNLALRDAQLRARQLNWPPLVAHAVSARGSASDGSALIAAAEARAFGGSWRGHANVSLDDGARTWSGAVHASGIDLDALLAALAAEAGAVPRSHGGRADLTVYAQHADTAPRGHAEVTLQSGSVAWDLLHVDAPASARGTFVVAGDDLALHGVTATAARATYGPLVATGPRAELAYGGNRLTFDSLRFRAAAGEWQHRGWFVLADDGPFAGQVSVTGANPQALAAMLGEAELAVPFAALDLDGDVSGRAVADWESSLRMSGSVMLRDGTMPAAAVLRPLWQALAGHGALRAHIDQPTRVQYVSNTFVLHRGRMETPDLTLVSDDYTVTGAGSIDLDGTLNLHTRINLTAAGMQKMFLFSAFPLPTSGLPPLPPIPAAVHGTLAAPIIRPDVAALPAATLRWFVDALIDTPRTVAGAVTGTIRRVWRGAADLIRP